MISNGIFKITFLSLISMFSETTLIAQLQSIYDLKWKNRIIIAKSTDGLVDELQNHELQIKERDIIWFVLSNDYFKTNYVGNISVKFDSESMGYYIDDKTSSILIGKDGTVKSRDKTFKLSQYFRLIDTMPMRKVEIKARESK